MTTPGVGGAQAPLLPVRAHARVDADGTTSVRPIAPVRPTVDPLLPDLQRAGIDLPTLLERGTDMLVTRDQPGAVALADVLERARGALVRGAPMEVLAALDTGWDGAARTESGWYFRAAALTLLGLPGEADRVLQQAVAVCDRSPALSFLQSVVHSAIGHASGARAALADALGRRPEEPLLRAWEAVLAARTGHGGGAPGLLVALQPGAAGNAVIAWAREAIQRASTADQRATRIADPAAAASSAPAFRAVSPGDAPGPALDPIDHVLRRFGARLGTMRPAEVQEEVRRLMQALSTSGSLHDAGRAEQAHAVRTVLATMRQLLGSEVGAADERIGADGVPRHRPLPPLASALEAFADAEGSWRLTPAGGHGVAPDARARALTDAPSMRRAVLHALLAGRPDDAGVLLAQANASEGESVVRVLRCLLDGAAMRGAARSGPLPADGEPTLAPSLSPVRDDGLLAPIRFGLILLQELSPRQEARAVRASTPSDGASLRAVGAVSRAGTASAQGTAPLRVLGLTCLVLAAVALLMGNGVVALLLAGGASWLLLR